MEYDRPRMLRALTAAGFVYQPQGGYWLRERDGARLDETALAGTLHEAVRHAEEFVYRAVRNGRNTTWRKVEHHDSALMLRLEQH